jgi:Uma2 family endonuclease
LLRGIEPDECYYIQHAAVVRDRSEIDLHVDPAPDLGVEVDLTSSALDKQSIYAALGIVELWRYDGQTTCVYALRSCQISLWTK